MVTADATQTNPPWGLDRIDQRNRPLNGTYTYNWTGSGVRVYVIDTGIRTAHTQFGGRASNVFDAFGGNGQDCNGHGTHVAGTVGGSDLRRGQERAAARRAGLNCSGSGSNSGVIAGVDWVRQNHIAPAVANMSLGGGLPAALDTAVNNLHQRGRDDRRRRRQQQRRERLQLIRRRAPRTPSPSAPRPRPTRARRSRTSARASIFSRRALAILSAWYTSNTATATLSGTSMASPHVAGVAALYKQANPSASSTTIRNAIVNNATTGVVTNAGSGSPNRLLYSLFF